MNRRIAQHRVWNNATWREPRVFWCLMALLSLSACNRSNNLLLGRVEAPVGPYVVVVTDCYRWSVPSPVAIRDSISGTMRYIFAPCKDADIHVARNELTVNGVSYGVVRDGDTVLVDHGTVIVNGVNASPRE
jgi:hypothetical protein